MGPWPVTAKIAINPLFACVIAASTSTVRSMSSRSPWSVAPTPTKCTGIHGPLPAFQAISRRTISVCTAERNHSRAIPWGRWCQTIDRGGKPVWLDLGSRDGLYRPLATCDVAASNTARKSACRSRCTRRADYEWCARFLRTQCCRAASSAGCHDTDSAGNAEVKGSCEGKELQSSSPAGGTRVAREGRQPVTGAWWVRADRIATDDIAKP
jgi:hypothetical protein